jgi:hypothetical protein
MGLYGGLFDRLSDRLKALVTGMMRRKAFADNKHAFWGPAIVFGSLLDVNGGK